MKPNEYMAKSQVINRTVKSRKLAEPIRVKNNGEVKELRFRRATVTVSRAKAVGMKAKHRADSTMDTEGKNESQYATDNMMSMGKDTVRETKNVALTGAKRHDKASNEPSENRAKEFIKKRFERKAQEKREPVSHEPDLKTNNSTSSLEPEPRNVKSQFATSRLEGKATAEVPMSKVTGNTVSDAPKDSIKVRGRNSSPVTIRGRGSNESIKVRQSNKAFVKTRGAEASSVQPLGSTLSPRVADAGTRKPKIISPGNRMRQQAKKAEAAKRTQAVAGKAAKETARTTKEAAVNTYRALKKAVLATKTLVTSLSVGGAVALVVIVTCTFFGASFYFFGDQSSSNYTPVSAEVEAYTPIITKYAKEFGIPEYVELIKAVMMQESGGRGLDPMQAAEGGYNTRYPREPNGIKDPDYSIWCGVQELKSVLVLAKVENPLDMDRIRLALQGYNYGPGYITWAVNRDGGYTVENASTFSDNQAARLGWSSYGDKQYVSHVLRYYPYGRYNYGIGNEVIVNVAAEQLGNEGGAKFWSWYGFNGRVEWCACFVSWCADQCGYIEGGIIPKFAGVGTGIDFFQARNQWQRPGYEPSAGDIIFFDWEPDGLCDHVGIVESCDGTYVYTIEGNTSDMCARRQYLVNSIYIYGYGVPGY